MRTRAWEDGATRRTWLTPSRLRPDDDVVFAVPAGLSRSFDLSRGWGRRTKRSEMGAGPLYYVAERLAISGPRRHGDFHQERLSTDGAIQASPAPVDQPAHRRCARRGCAGLRGEGAVHLFEGSRSGEAFAAIAARRRSLVS